MTADRSVQRVQEQLRKTTAALEKEGVPFAVIGGNAVALWVGSVNPAAVRTTKDVDILLRRQDLWRAAAAMQQAGFIPEEVHGVSMFLDREDPLPSRGVHVVIAGEKVRPEYTHAAPDLANAARSADGVPIVSLYDLLIMKLQSCRDLDRAHIRDLMKVGLITQEIVNPLPADLRERFEGILANPET